MKTSHTFQIGNLIRSNLARNLGLATTKSCGTGDLISKRVVEEKGLVHLVNYTV